VLTIKNLTQNFTDEKREERIKEELARKNVVHVPRKGAPALITAGQGI
jgi:hypothetical protein